MKKITALLVSIAMLMPLCLIPRPAQAAITLGDANYTTLSKVDEANSCNSTQGMAVNDSYVYSAQIKSSDGSRAVIYRVNKTTGATVLMKDASTNLTYFTNLGHANAMDIAVVNGVEYLCILTDSKISLFAISGTTLTFYAEYYITHNGSVIAPSAISVYQVSGTTITFLTKGGRTVSKGSVNIASTSGTIPVTIQCELDYSKIRINGKIQDFSSFTNQGMGYYGNYVFVPITGNKDNATINQSLILGYDLTKATGGNTIQPDPDKIFHVVSYQYQGLFEIEDVDIDKNGQMYFNTNSRISSTDTKHDGVFRLNDYTFGRAKPAATAPVLRDSAFTEIAPIPTTEGCTGNQGMAVGDDYLYSVQIKTSHNSRAVIHRIDKKTGADTVMTDGKTGLSYFTNLNHANCADWGRVNGVEYLYILASYKIVVLKINGTTLTQCAEYNLKYNGNSFGPGSFALYKVSDTHLTFLFKWNGVTTQSTISSGTIPIGATSGNISVSILGYAHSTDLPIDEAYLTPSGWLTQGMDCVGDMLYTVITGNHVKATISHSLIIGYDLTEFTGNNHVWPEVKDILYVVSDQYLGLFEVEDVGFDQDGKMYFNTNGWKDENGVNADGVYVMNDFLFGGAKVSGTVSSMNPGKPMEIRLMQNGVAVKTVTIAAGSGTGETAQTFAFGEVTPGTYDLQIVKAGHLPCTVTGIPVSDSVDLSDLLSRTPLIPGNLNGDNVVDLNDLIILTADNTFNRPAASAQTPAADINGDGLVDLNDLIILTSDSNFNKGATVLPFTP